MDGNIKLPGGGVLPPHAHGPLDLVKGTTTPSASTAYMGDGTWQPVFTQAQVTALLAAVALAAQLPIGSIYTSTVATNPATTLGYGTWTAFGAGRVLVGYSAGDPDFGTPGGTTGAKTSTPTGVVTAPTISGSTASESSHTHSVTTNVGVAAHTFTQPTISWPAGVPTAANESTHTHAYTGVIDHTHTITITDPGHTHNISLQGGGTVNIAGTHVTASVAAGGSQRDANADSYAKSATTGITASASSTGAASQSTAAGSAHTHTLSWPAGVPTASSGAVDAHSVSNPAVTSAAGSAHSHAVGTLAASTPTFTGSPLSVLQPSVTVYLWLRTA